MLREDVNLQLNDIQMLSDRSQVAAFFGRLGYDLETRLPLTPEALSITSAELQRQITHVEQIANQGGELYVYLFEMKAMRAADRLALARAFRNASGEFLLAITSDYQALDFVLLERQLPESTATGISRKQVAIHPHVLSVNRANPDPVDLRVLRRFSYTEDDPFYQYDKLLSAYTVAEWSEPLFNNRALFSDYYLNTRLRDSAEWGEDPLPIYQQLHALLANVRARLAAEDEATTRRKLLEPAFEALGFRAEAFPNGTEDPDYRLYDPQAGPDAAPLVRCLTYKWDRYLDGPDEQRDDETPDENPAAKVVSLLEDGETPYVIVTNGKLWRLYAARAHSRATNYYEIDLSEAILPADAADRADSIRYFWLFFRRDAFTPQAIMREGEQREVCFLDRLLEGSAAYAKELEERLKDRIFEQIFPHFAEGFITYIRQTEGKDADLSQARLDGIYRGTLTFLYRLMFLLYAEARDLLPVKDDHGYHTASLRRLKTEIAARAGTIEDAAPAAIRKTFAENSNALYDRLAALFVVIDRGAPSLNVPRYNGGLFITQPPEDGDSPEYEDARFLRDCKIPDRFLALGLDRLARDVDAKTHALVMIDYKSLGVRQLGSIYEGLLEFKLRVAPEKMAIVKGKRTEEVIPYRGANKKDILTTGRGQNKQERTLPKGAVYLENTRQERKATGSYYTPDYIVKYIVEHTVGPVLDEKFKVLSPRLAEAERLYHQRRKNALAKGEDSEKFWNRDDMQSLAYDVLDVKVLDPAMGSGHFLVEAVDFITDRMIKFLNGYRHNPVWASLKRTRTSILDAMDDQGVSIDHKQLDEIPLLK
ncbi:MAG: hypothetical protein JXN59_18170, partial [Anaerolineae bacterium]|nr:hypothetical protein [Anaerolineae bacterium]